MTTGTSGRRRTLATAGPTASWSGIRPGRFYYGVFGAGLPDLNLRNPAVTAELEDVARFWLEDIGIDGFRLDAIKHLVEDGERQVHTPETHAWLTAFRPGVEADQAGRPARRRGLRPDRRRARYVPEDVDLVFDFGLAAGRPSTRSSRGAAARPRLAPRTEDCPACSAGTNGRSFLTNHDQERIASQLARRSAAMRLAAASLLLTSPGVPFIYYGEEIGLTGEKPDEQIRTPMAWDGSARRPASARDALGATGRWLADA